MSTNRRTSTRWALPWALGLAVITCTPLVAAQAPPPSSTTVVASAGSTSADPAEWPPGLREAVERARPRERPYEESKGVRSGYHLVNRPNSGLIAAGGVLFTVFYGIGAIAGISAGTWLGIVPVAGPILIAGSAEQPRSSDSLDRAAHDAGLALLVVDALVQGLGLAMTVGGMTSSTKVQVPNSLSAERGGPFLRVDPGGLSLVF